MEKNVTIVSGIPRSGTSMMMKMLKEGGLPLYYTTPDKGNIFNPDGYFETTYLKGIHINPSVIVNADGKAMKAFAQQLNNLPEDFYGKVNYKVIFMVRDPVASARSFANMKGIEVGNEADIIERYDKTRAGVTDLINYKDNMEILYVNYDDVLEDPETECHRIKNFLGLDLNIEEMSAVPDSNKRHYEPEA